MTYLLDSQGRIRNRDGRFAQEPLKIRRRTVDRIVEKAWQRVKANTEKVEAQMELFGKVDR